MTKLFQNYNRLDIEFIKAEGNYLFDQAGKKYLDFSSGIGVTNLGFHPQIKIALQKQADKIWHTPNLYVNSLQEEVAGKLIGDKNYLAFFANSGTEANEAAIKIARKATGKQGIVTFTNSFHGRTYGSMSATGQDKIKVGFGDMLPHFSYAQYNHFDTVKKAVTDDTAAIMLELIQGESGIHPADKDFVMELNAFCQKTGILLIVDEVQTGMGRTGKLFSFEHYGIEPDIFTLAKGLGNGVPVGAMIAKEKFGLAFSYGSHGSTFGGNKLAMSAASSVLDVLLSEGFLSQVIHNSDYLNTELQKSLSKTDKVIEVRGLGYMIGIETTENLSQLVQKARDKGLIILTAGTNVIRLLPPLMLTKSEIDHGIRILKDIFLEE